MDSWLHVPAMVKWPHCFWTLDDSAYSGGEHRVEQNCSLNGDQKEEWTKFPMCLSVFPQTPNSTILEMSLSNQGLLGHIPDPNYIRGK